MEEVMQRIRTFRDERDWMQFHDLGFPRYSGHF
jgi:hypothetical protein